MIGSRILGFACLLACLTITSHAEQPSAVKPVVSLTPATVEAGSPELIVISTPNAKSVSGEWLGHKLEFFQRGQKWFALAGVDVEGAAGPSTLRISAQLDDGGPLDLSQAVEIHPAHYRTGTLTVPPKFVEPGPEEQKRDCGRRRSQDEGLRIERIRAAVAWQFSRAGSRRANGQLRHAAHVQRQAGQRSQGHGFSRSEGNSGSRRQTAESSCWRGRSTTRATA